eukprot:6972137-Prymnesium_polylepis.1
MINLKLLEYVTIQLCPAAYAFLAGLKGSTAQTVIQRIKDDVPLSAPVQRDEEHESGRPKTSRSERVGVQ